MKASRLIRQLGDHTAEQILNLALSQKVGVLSSSEKNSENLRQRLMYFGLSETFSCYLMSSNESPKIEQIAGCPQVSFFVFGIEEPYDNSWEVELIGSADVLPDDVAKDEALHTLIGRNPFADVTDVSGISGQFSFIRIIPKQLRFRIYGEALQGVDPTIFTFES